MTALLCRRSGYNAEGPPAPSGRSLSPMAVVKVDQTAELVWQARVDGLMAGSATVHPGSEPAASFVRLVVDPLRRRQGVGGRLFEAVGVGLDGTGCRTLEGIVVVGTDGEAFARGLGAEVGDELTDDVLRFAKIDLAQLGALRVLPTGYDLARWSGSAPERLVDSYAQAKRWLRDAPNRHPPIIPDWHTDLIRAGERERTRRGARLWVEAAVMIGSDTVVAFSEIETSDTGAGASQHDTVVLPAHRRSRLATSLKAGLTLRLHAARPDIGSIEVTCALANIGMQAVNHRLGFRQARRRNLYRLPL